MAARKQKAEPTTLERLVELRDVLHGQVLAAEPKNVARVSAEYRATIAEIDRMQGGGADEPGNQLAEFLAQLGSAAARGPRL